MLNGKLACDSQAIYGGNGFAAGYAGSKGEKWETISSMSECTTPIAIKKGDKIVATAYYDLAEHPL